MDFELKILPTYLLHDYLEQIPKNLQQTFDALHDAEISNDSFSFYTSISSVYSSKIEGEEIELDNYIICRMLMHVLQKDFINTAT